MRSQFLNFPNLWETENLKIGSYISYGNEKNGVLRFETLKGLNSPKIETRPPKLFFCFALQSNKMPLLSQTVYKQKVEKN